MLQTLYVGPFRNAVNIHDPEVARVLGESARRGIYFGQTGLPNYYDIQVGRPLIDAWRQLKTGADRRMNEVAVRLQDDIRRIFGFRSLDINPSHDGQTFQVFVDGRSYDLGELGSGLAQFFVVLANAATKNPPYILIDEPELNLHPLLQLDFLTTLASYTRESGILFATHSYGLARASAERLYVVRRGADGVSEVMAHEEVPNLSEFLGELGFSAYRDLGANKVLLVEGPSELRVMQQLLRFYHKDHEVVLLPLGGGQGIRESPELQLEELKRLAGRVSAVVDSERAAPRAALDPRIERFAQACANADIRCRVLERRAIENYLSDRAVKQVKGEKYRALEPYERLKDLPHGWAKAENWRIAREMTVEELHGTDLDDFLSSL